MQAADLGRVALDRLAETAGQPADTSRAQEHANRKLTSAANDARAVIFPRPAREEAAVTCWRNQSNMKDEG